MRFVAFIAVLFLVATPASAKLKVRIVMRDETQTEMLEMLKARINSTERYSATSNPVAMADLQLSVSCLALEDQFKQRKGIACASYVSYFPPELGGLSSSVTGAENVVVGGTDTDSVANSLINKFINGTTDDVLKEQTAFIRLSITLACQNNSDICRPAPKKP